MRTTKTQEQSLLEAMDKLIRRGNVAMLTSASSDGQWRSRPMIPLKQPFSEGLWFFTVERVPWVIDLEEHPTVNVSFTDGSNQQFASISARATVVRDRQRMKKLWQDELREWFAEGLKTADLVLLHLEPSEVEMWAKHATSTERLLSSMFSWRASAEEVHQKIEWKDRAHPRTTPAAKAAAKRGSGAKAPSRSAKR